MNGDLPNEDWQPLAVIARKINRDPRVLRRWANDGMLTRVIEGVRHTKLRYAHLHAAEHPLRPRKHHPPKVGHDTTT